MGELPHVLLVTGALAPLPTLKTPSQDPHSLAEVHILPLGAEQENEKLPQLRHELPNLPLLVGHGEVLGRGEVEHHGLEGWEVEETLNDDAVQHS